MSPKNIVTMLIPAIIMSLVSILSFTKMFGLSDQDMKSLMVVGVLIIFPLVFFIQGVMCSLTHTNVYLAFAVSLITYIVIMFTFLNSSAFVYVIVYLFIWAIGYGIGKLVIKANSAKDN